MEEIKPRITGIETEYGLTYRVNKRADDNAIEIAKTIDIDHLLLDNLPEGTVPGLRGLLTNGDRLYVDMGEHPEHSTAEATSFREVVAHDLAGEHIVYSPFEESINQGILESFDLNKRVVDMNNTYWGRHENYLVPRDIDARDFIVPAVALHLATRSIWSGAGMVKANGAYSLAQKMNAVGALTQGTASSTSRPLVDVSRDEALADNRMWRRLHVASVDANMIPWATWMSLGTTSLVLRMVETGDLLGDLHLNNPVKSAHQVIGDTSLYNKLVLMNSKKTKSALDIQSTLAERACKMAQKHKLPQEEVEIAENWQQICSDLRNDPEQCFDRVEWIAKRHVLGQIATKKHISWDSIMMRNLDIQWDNLDLTNGFAQKLRQKERFATTVSKDDIAAALTEPPESRAKLRGDIIRTLWSPIVSQESTVKDRTVNWHEASYKKAGDTVKSISLLDPYQTESEDVAEFLNTVFKDVA